MVSTPLRRLLALLLVVMVIFFGQARAIALDLDKGPG
jgi:hypothetical protein